MKKVDTISSEAGKYASKFGKITLKSENCHSRVDKITSYLRHSIDKLVLKYIQSQ